MKDVLITAVAFTGLIILVLLTFAFVLMLSPVGWILAIGWIIK